VRADEQSEKIKRVWKLAASPQIKSDSCPPGVLDQIIEVVFPFAAFRRFNFDARLLSIQSIDETKYERSNYPEPDAAERKSRSRAGSDDET